MHFIYALIAFILSMLLVVGLHEAGHALVARFFNVKITRISIGFGKPLLRYKNAKGITWVWALFPLGGYVELLNTRIAPVKAQQHTMCFDKKPWYARILILLAGACANIITAWLLFMLVFMLGYKQSPPIIDSINADSVASKANFTAHSQILSIAGHKTPSIQEAGMQLIMHLGEQNVEVELAMPNGTNQHTQLDLSTKQKALKDKHLFRSLGIVFTPFNIKSKVIAGVPFTQASINAYHTIADLTTFFFVMIKQLILSKVPISFLLGPLGLFTAMTNSFLHGLSTFLYFIGSLSLAVAVVNLLPIPGLDGGSIVYTLIEKMRGKPISIALEVLLYRLAMIVFYVFLVQLIINDFK